MAKGVNAGFNATGVVNPGSVKSSWSVLHFDATDDDTGLDVTAFTSGGFRWTPVPSGATRVVLSTKIASGTPSAPVVRVLGMYGEPDGLGVAIAGVPVMRVDAAGNATGTGVTVPAGTDANSYEDSTGVYSQPTDWDGIDLRGAQYVGVQVVTAADAACEIIGLFLN